VLVVSFRKRNIVMVVVIFLVLVGQSFAAVASCDNEISSQNTHMTSHMTAVEMADLVDVIIQGEAECCTQNYDCSMETCVAILFPAVSHPIDALPKFSQIVHYAPLMALSQLPSSLYRPPMPN